MFKLMPPGFEIRYGNLTHVTEDFEGKIQETTVAVVLATPC